MLTVALPKGALLKDSVAALLQPASTSVPSPRPITVS